MKNIVYILLITTLSFGMTLQEAYENSESAFGYDKYVVLEPSSIYTGGVGIYEGSTYINCQGSIIDLEEGIESTIKWVDRNLDILKNLPHEYIHKAQ